MQDYFSGMQRCESSIEKELESKNSIVNEQQMNQIKELLNKASTIKRRLAAEMRVMKMKPKQ